jgi:riboflavin biosynthesis pyrimidine reductase
MSESTLEPLLLLHEPAGLPRFELPDELRQLYGSDLGLPPHCLFTNFVTTIDGVVAIPDLPHSNKLISDGSEADRFVMGLLRACADAVLVGSGTMRSAPRTLWTAEQAYPPAATHYAELRRRRGGRARPEIAILSASGSIDLAHPVLEADALVLTTERGAAKLRDRLPASSQIVVLPGNDSVDVRAAVAHLRRRGHELILSEGGPTLFGSLLAADLVDELFLTVSPLLAGRTHGEARHNLVEGAELLPSHPARSRLLGIRSHDDHLFLRYGLERNI